jgi:hypothetical protein
MPRSAERTIAPGPPAGTGDGSTLATDALRRRPAEGVADLGEQLEVALLEHAVGSST